MIETVVSQAISSNIILMQQHDLTNIPQIKVSFSHKIPFEERPHISNSQDAIKVFLAHWDKDLMNVQKEMYILYLDPRTSSNWCLSSQ